MKKLKTLTNICSFIIVLCAALTVKGQNLVHNFEFNNNLNDSKPTGVVLSAFNATATSFGVNEWTWSTNVNPGAGLVLTTSLVTNPQNYSVGFRIKYDQTSPGYRKIISFLGAADDKGLYFQNQNLGFFPFGNNTAITYSNNTYYDFVLTRNLSDTIKVYVVQGSTVTQVYNAYDPTDSSVPTVSGSNYTFRFFMDDTQTNTEYTSGGSVKAIRLWDAPLSAAEIASALSVVTTGSVQNITSNTGVLTGQVNPLGVSSTFMFEYGLTSALGQTLLPSPASGSGNVAVSIQGTVTGLAAATTYYYRLSSTNISGSTYGAIKTFTTLAPGGVSGNIVWLKANVGTSSITNSTTISNWIDQASAINFTQTSSNQQPVYLTNANNFNPAVRFDGTNTDPDNDWLSFSGSMYNPNINHSLFMIVYKATSGNVSASILNSSSQGRYISITGNYNESQSFTGVSGSAVNPNNSSYLNSVVMNSTLGLSTFRNGDLQNSGTTNTVSNLVASFIGGSEAGGHGMEGGSISEYIVFPTVLSATDQNKVLSYLAIKYGISLGNNTNPVMYTSSTNATIWPSSSTYKYDVFGIGQDDGSGLFQPQSNSMNTGSGNGTGQSGKGNIVLSNASSLDNLDFLMVGHDNGSLTEQTSELPANLIGAKRIAREWLVKRTGNPGTVSLTFDINGLTIGGSAKDQIKLLIDTDANFSSGANIIHADSLVGNKVYFNNLNINDGSYLTFITNTGGPALSGSILWLNAGSGVLNGSITATDGQSVNSWIDQSGARVNQATAAQLNPPTYRTSGQYLLNFNPTIEFDGLDDGLDFFDDYLFASSAQGGLTFFTVVKPDNAAIAKDHQFVFDMGYFNNEGYGFTYGNSNSIIYSPLDHSGATSSASHTRDTSATLARVVYNFGNQQSVHFDGQTAATFSGNVSSQLTSAVIAELSSHSNNLNVSSGGGPFTVGRQAKENSFLNNSKRAFDGKIAELIGYLGVPTASDMQKVESYLAIKYGIHLSGNYVNSSGTTLWDATINSTYHNNVFGIGKDNISNLNQTSSNSMNSGSGDGTGQNGKGNLVLSNASSLDNNDFLLIGHDNGTLTEQTSDLPASEAGNKRLSREWKVKHTNNVGTVNLSFNTLGLCISGLAASDFKLLVDTDGDGNFSTGSITAYTATTFTSNLVSFNGISLSDNVVFTIGMIPTKLTLSSAPGTDNQSTCISTSITNITYQLINGLSVTSTGLPAGLTGSFSSGVYTITGSPSVAGTFIYTLNATSAACPAAPSLQGTITVTPNNSVGIASSSPTLCINTLLANITHTTSGASGIGSAIGLPSGLSSAWSANTISISGTPSQSGIFSYTIPLTGGCSSVNATGTINVTPNNSVGIASSNPTLCINTVLANITHTTSGASGIGSAIGLPTGLSAAWSANTITISGTPSQSGVFSYSIPLTGGCSSVNATGTITVRPNNAVGLASANPTLCINTVLANITHTTSGASGIGSAIGLPTGLSAAWSANTITISGTPSQSGVFSYSIPLTGGCSSVNATGTINVTPNNSVGIASSSPTLCINTVLANITHTTFGASGIGAPVGLPTGLSAAWSANTITISGTPSQSGVFSYSIPLTGGCSSVNATGTIMVRPNNAVGLASASPTLCINTVLSTLTHTTSGATGIGTAMGLPTGVSAAWSANTISISGTPGQSGIFSYTIPLTGGCSSVNATGTINVSPVMITSAALVIPTICVNSSLSVISHTTANGVTGIGSGTGLPLGVSASWSSNSITISGTPSQFGIFSYTIPLAGGCGTANATGTLVVNGLSTIGLTSASGTSAQVVCPSISLSTITYSIGLATGATFSGLPAGITGNYSGGIATISGAASSSGTFNYTVTTSGGCAPAANANGVIIISPLSNVLLTSAANTSAQVVCPSSSITTITYSILNASGATVTGLPSGVTASFSGGLVTLNGTAISSGVYAYTVTTSGGCAPPANALGSIIVQPLANLNLTSGSVSNNQLICKNVGISLITYTFSNASGINFSGLPAGVSGTTAANSATISGTPSVSGVFNYTLTTTGGCPPAANAFGSIIVQDLPEITLLSASTTTNQTLCVNTAISQISYSISHATGASAAGLPGSLTSNFNAGTFTIGGVLTNSGVFNYTITTSGGCSPNATSLGSITGKEIPAITLISAPSTENQTVCINSSVTPVVYGVSGLGSGSVSINGLPSGVNGFFSANAYTVAGTPSVSGLYNYTFSIVGGCPPNPSAVGSIKIDSAPLPSGSAFQSFGFNATVNDLVVSGASITWFASLNDALANSNLLGSSTPLVNGGVYYAVNFDGLCYSSPFEVTVAILTDLKELTMNDFKVYPIPNEGTIHVSLNYSDLTIYIRLTDVLGKVIFENTYSSTKDIEFNFEGAKGIYFMETKVGDSKFIHKIIKN